jgi:hypothetical protein
MLIAVGCKNRDVMLQAVEIDEQGRGIHLCE